MRVHRAAWVLPITAPPLADAWIAVEHGRVVAVGAGADLPAALPRDAWLDDRSSGTTAILPGLVNAHAHLELSWMRALVPPASSMPEWAAALIALRRTVSVDPAPFVAAAVADAHTSGTCLVGDVANTLITYPVLAASALSAVLFREMIGFTVDEPAGVIAAAEAELDALPAAANVRTTLAAHAPYSVSPQLVAALGARPSDLPFAMHLAESVAELELLQDGSGYWRQVLEEVGAWSPFWQPPGCGPVDYLDHLGVVGPRLLAAHGVQLTFHEMTRLAAAGATIVTCPRSNAWTGAGTPPIARFYESGVRVAIGTDSLASVDSLDMFAEVAAVRRLAPEVPARSILHSATRAGAAALGFPELGSIAAGQTAALLAVRIPPDLDDVEEYLVEGHVTPADLRWL